MTTKDPSSQPNHVVPQNHELNETQYFILVLILDPHLCAGVYFAQERPSTTVVVSAPRPDNLNTSATRRPSLERPPHADDITPSLVAAECSRLTLLLQAQADCSLLPLIQEARWLWPSKEEVHGDRATIHCADDTERYLM